jgi:hypothetical protein
MPRDPRVCLSKLYGFILSQQLVLSKKVAAIFNKGEDE